MRPCIGLVLGGGGSRGLAHIGVLKVLERESIPIDMIVGTSMGAIVGGSFAIGYSPNAIEKRMGNIKGRNLFSMNIFSENARQKVLREQLTEAFEGKTFKDTNIPLSIMAVDMVSGTEITLQDGKLMPAVLASSAVPVVFPPVRHKGMQLADGGVLDSLATHVAYEMGADKVIAVDVWPPLQTDDPWKDPLSAVMGFQLPFNILSSGKSEDKNPSMLSSLWRSFRVMASYVHENRLANHPADVLLRPEVHGYGSLDFNDTEGPISAGEAIANENLSKIKALLENSSKQV